MTTFRTFASGSTGNAALLSCGETHLLIDMGISCRRVCQALAGLGLGPEDLSGVLITHEHTDHISGLATYIKKNHTPILTTPGTARQLAYRLAGVEPLLRPAPLGSAVQLGDASVRLLPTSHDCAESAAFRFDTPDGSIGYLTDTGYIPQETGEGLLGAELLVLESNHDPDMLLAGPYPYALKRRVLGESGHLSNADAGRYAAHSVRAGTRRILLAHLSRENNFPQLALETVGGILREEGLAAELAAAPSDRMSGTYTLEGRGMQRITVICVGKLKEKFYAQAAEEYLKRLGRYCKLELIELPEQRLPENPSPAEIQRALEKEAEAIRAKAPPSAALAALCIEGKLLSSEEFSRLLDGPGGGEKGLAFVIGSSFGLHPALKSQAWARLSMSPMTFPHHLARVMLLEQIYRGFQIREGGKYHK